MTIIKFKGWKTKLSQIKLLRISCIPRFCVKATGKIPWPVLYPKTVWRNIKSLLPPLPPLPHAEHWNNSEYFIRIPHISVNQYLFIQVFKLKSTWVSTLWKAVQATCFVWAKIPWKSRLKFHSLHAGYTGATGAGLKSTECASGVKNMTAWVARYELSPQE